MTTSTEQVEHLVEDIRVRLVENRYDDPGLAPDLLAYVMREIGELAANTGMWPRWWSPAHQGWASQLLLAMQSRAAAGGWPEPPEHPYERVLDESERTGD